MSQIQEFAEIEISYKPKFLSLAQNKATSSKDVYQIFLSLFDPKQLHIKEECYALFLNRNNRIFGSYKVSSGGITSTVVDIRLILSIALKSLSTGLIIAHSHPSGNLVPSNADFQITKRLKEAAELMDISLIDHLIISCDSYYSFADHGEM